MTTPRGSGTGGGCWSAAPRSAWTTSRVGLALGTVRFPILLAVTAFGLMSFVMSIIGLQLGAKLGTVTGERGDWWPRSCCICLSGVMAAGRL